MRKAIFLLCMVVTLLSFSGCEKTYTHEVYAISITATQIYNDSVGSDWYREYVCNGEVITSGKQWTIPVGSTKTVTIDITVTEHDKYPDIGYGSLDVTLVDGFKTSTTVIVTEDKGKFKGNEAMWEITCSIELVEQIGHYAWIDTVNEFLDDLIDKFGNNVFIDTIKSLFNDTVNSLLSDTIAV